MSLKKNDENGKDKLANRFTAGSVPAKTAAITTTTSTGAVSIPTTAKPVMARKSPTQQEIAARAWELWKKQGCQAGRDLENWLEAEKQLRG